MKGIELIRGNVPDVDEGNTTHSICQSFIHRYHDHDSISRSVTTQLN